MRLVVKEVEGVRRHCCWLQGAFALAREGGRTGAERRSADGIVVFRQVVIAGNALVNAGYSVLEGASME